MAHKPDPTLLLQQLDFRYLLLAAEAGNFSRAASNLGLQSSTISRRIARLEDRLGVTLFERSRSGIRLTAAGRTVVVQVRRAIGELEAVVSVSKVNGNGFAGRVRLGLQMPPVAEPIRDFLAAWHKCCPDVQLTLYEMNENEIRAALAERRLDVALVPKHTLWPDATAMDLYKEVLMVALPEAHPLCGNIAVRWERLRETIILTQEWEDSHEVRTFYASLLGPGTRFSSHSASKQTILALVSAGLGATLVTAGQAKVSLPGVIYRPIAEEDAWLQMAFAWRPESEEPAVGRFIAIVRDEARMRGFL